jgi:hypothetical protein
VDHAQRQVLRRYPRRTGMQCFMAGLQDGELGVITEVIGGFRQGAGWTSRAVARAGMLIGPIVVSAPVTVRR